MNANKETLIQYILDNVTPDYEYNGLPVYTIDGEELAIAASEEEADKACEESIRETVWAFNSDFLSGHIECLDSEDIDRLRGDRCEEANEPLTKLIDDWEDFVSDAVACDGRGHFLSCYDGEEHEEGGILIYRIN